MTKHFLQSNMIPGNNRGEVHPHDAFFGFGERDISGISDNEDLWEGPTAIQPEPDTGGYALFVESSDAADTLLGTGIRSVEIHYLDTAGVEQLVSADLDGVTPVDTGVTDCMFVNDFHALAVGSVTVSVGNVDATSGSGGIVVARISTSGNKSLSTMRQVPAGYNLFITGWYAVGVATTVKIATIRLRATQHNGDSIPGVYHYLSTTRVKDFSSPWISLNYKVHPLTTVKISVWTTGTISVSGHWDGYLEKI